MSSGLPLKADIARCTRHVSKVPKADSTSMPGFRSRPITFSVRPAHCAATIIYLRSITASEWWRPQRRFGISHVAARSKRARRNVALQFWSQRHDLFDSGIFSVRGAHSIEARACLSFGTTGTRLWSRWRRSPLSSLLSWWLLGLLRLRNVGGDKRGRQRLIWETSANRSFRCPMPGKQNVCF